MLTLPSVFEEVFALAGRRFDEVVDLIQPQPAFQYLFGDGTELLLHSDLERSVLEVERSLSPEAGGDGSG